MRRIISALLVLTLCVSAAAQVPPQTRGRIGVPHGFTFLAGGGGDSPFSVPAFFSSKVYFPVALTFPTSTTFSTDFDPVAFRDTGGPYCIDAATGNDTTGTGTFPLCWATISKAYTTVPTGSLVNMAAGQYAPPLSSEAAAKSVSFVGASLGSVYICNCISNAEVNSWGTFASNKQTVSLTTGTIGGFVDLTRTEYVAGVPQVSNNTGSGAFASTQALGKAVIQTGTNAILGTGDNSGAGRDLTGTAGTGVLMWRSAGAPRFFNNVVGGQTYFENITFVGEGLIDFGGGTVIMHNTRYLGSVNAVTAFTAGTIIIHNMDALVGTGSVCGGVGGSCDSIDSNFRAVVENVNAYQQSSSIADSAFTSHSGVNLLVNNNWVGGQAGATIREGREGVFGGSVAGLEARYRAGAIANYNTDAHLKGVAFVGPTPSLAGINLGSIANNTAVYAYDAAPLAQTTTGPALQNLSGSKPTTMQVELTFDPSVIGTMWQDATCNTTPVAANGDPVQCIKDSSGNGTYATIAAGSATYVTTGKPHIHQVSTLWTLNAALPFHEDTTFIYGLVTSDTTFILNWQSTTTFVDFRSTGTPYASGVNPFPISANGGFTVDGGSVLTTQSAIKTALSNGVAHVLMQLRADFLWTPWRTMHMFTGQTTSNALDGDVYGVRAVWNATDAELATERVRMAGKM
jgi:uncharacterized Zn-binding protein involved in type VI secretion